jgi:hypothetical protein
MKNPRRERLAEAGGVVAVFVNILFLRMLRVIKTGIRLPGILRTPRCEPGNYVCDFLIGHRLSTSIVAPVGGA